MDVQGTRFHLLHGRPDWAACIEGGAPLGPRWDGHDPAPLEWDARLGALRLTRSAPTFEQASNRDPVGQQARRGSGRDRYGNWYWIGPDEQSIRFLPSGRRHSVEWWRTADLGAECEASDPSGFAVCAPPPPPSFLLRGLAVTTHHYLVAGFESRDSSDGFHGLLVFDLHAGGAPLVLTWPGDTPFAPWDLAPLPDASVAVLDQRNRAWWRLDRSFRLMAAVEEDEPLFVPADGTKPTVATSATTARPVARPLHANTATAIAIEAGPDNGVLVFDGSTVWLYGAGVDGALVERWPVPGGLAGHDIAYVASPQGQPLPGPMLFVAHADGNQTTAFVIDLAQHELVAQPDYLPMRRWQAKALVAAGDAVFYDFADRWVPLQVFAECVYEREATFTTPTAFDPAVPGMPFDSGTPGCVWHRLMLDLALPPGTEVSVRARACDDADLLTEVVWVPQPTPYLRSGGCELPWINPWADASGVVAVDQAGTWELLFQQVTGRYAEIEVTLRGTGRSSPSLRSMRAWFPRFSYVEHYLPAIYDEDQGASRFTERFLANFEGLLTNLEDRIDGVDALFDPETAPPDALDWLASWFGLGLDPQWDEARKRFFLAHADRLFRERGTVRGVTTALRLFLDAEVSEAVFGAGGCTCAGARSPVRIVEQFLVRDAGGVLHGDPTATEPMSVADAAHRFTVLVPHVDTAEREAMVRRIVELAKPAHTSFDVKRFWALFRVGEARVGLDTELGESSAFEPTVLGDSALAEGYLQPTHPFDVADRVVIDRDRVGGLPVL
jgi:phage tail-like protein